jgi:hypothetical protein
MGGVLATAGELVAISSRLPWLDEIIEDGCDGRLTALSSAPGSPTVMLEIESSRRPFPIGGLVPIARGVYGSSSLVVMEDVGSSGLDLAIGWNGDVLHVTTRWRPTHQERIVSVALPTRNRLLLREVLLQYPAMWRAGVRGRAPLHASVCRRNATVDGTVRLIAGPSGVGKSTFVQRDLSVGGDATCDNLCVCDGTTAWGVVEPVRVPSSVAGRRSTHGRRETTLGRRVEHLDPTMIVLLRRSGPDPRESRFTAAEVAFRTLVTGTFMAGELRRYWGFAATLALATGEGPAEPEVAQVARRLADRLPASEVFVPEHRDVSGAADILPPRLEAIL